MIVERYKRPPAPPRVAVLSEAGLAMDELGQACHPDELEAGVRLFAQWDVVRLLLADGKGEALCWNNEEIRWRASLHPEEPDWRTRPGDAFVLRLPLTERLTPPALLRGVVAWRDWLAGWGAAPTGTTGSSAFSLLRARTGRRVVCGQGERPSLLQTRGGRSELGPHGQGTFRGPLMLLDLPSAYARLIGVAEYGGIWRHLTAADPRLGRYLEKEAPMFVSAQVRVPKALPYGPLMRCFRRPLHFMEQMIYSRTREPDGTSFLYPTGRRVAGVWTRAEILAALDAGCSVKIREAWVELAPGQPFLPWWEAVQDGRARMTGVEELLAKMTANALWGRFCLDPKLAGSRSVRVPGRPSRRLQWRPAPPPAHDLAEHVSGTVRGELFRLMQWAGDRLVSANTDGAWVRDDGTEPPEGWRVKARTSRLDLLGPTCLRYWRGRWPAVVFAGVPALEAAEAFQREWDHWIELQPAP